MSWQENKDSSESKTQGRAKTQRGQQSPHGFGPKAICQTRWNWASISTVFLTGAGDKRQNPGPVQGGEPKAKTSCKKLHLQKRTMPSEDRETRNTCPSCVFAIWIHTMCVIPKIQPRMSFKVVLGSSCAQRILTEDTLRNISSLFKASSHTWGSGDTMSKFQQQEKKKKRA